MQLYVAISIYKIAFLKKKNLMFIKIDKKYSFKLFEYQKRYLRATLVRPIPFKISAIQSEK